MATAASVDSNTVEHVYEGMLGILLKNMSIYGCRLPSKEDIKVREIKNVLISDLSLYKRVPYGCA